LSSCGRLRFGAKAPNIGALEGFDVFVLEIKMVFVNERFVLVQGPIGPEHRKDILFGK
jgi:hypothetical protein